MKKADVVKQELEMKEQRVMFWETFHSIPTISDLIMLDNRGEHNVA